MREYLHVMLKARIAQLADQRATAAQYGLLLAGIFLALAGVLANVSSNCGIVGGC